jgi:DNA-directed RNA polymerase subunit RPC12/RpoP
MQAQEYNVYDCPACPRCGREMSLLQRLPHPARGDGFELQTFSCLECGHQIERTEDNTGRLWT